MSDTSAEARRVQIEVARRLGSQERFRTASLMCQSLREMAMARIRTARPELDERGIHDQLIFELYGYRRDET